MRNKKDNNTNALNGFLSSEKTLLVVCASLALVADLVLVIYSLFGGIGFITFQSIALAVGSGLLLFSALNTNYRFAYGRIYPIIYCVLSIVLTVVTASIYATVILTNIAFVICLVTRLVTAIAVLVTTLNASKINGFFRFIALVFTALTVAVSSYYSVYLITDGYFGQGGFGYRNIIYSYNDDLGGYVAGGYAEGISKKVEIPYEYNGEKVVKVNANLFGDDKIEEIYFNCDSSVIIDTENVNFKNINSNLKIYVDKNQVDIVKQAFKLKVETISAEYKNGFVSLMNSVTPGNLLSDEKFITFDYTLDSLQYAKYQTIPTWIGNKNEKFDLQKHAEGISYVQNALDRSESYFYDCYENNLKALKSLTYDGNDINGIKVSGNMSNVTVDFETVYRVKINEGNDTKKPVLNSFTSFNSTGYRYTVKSSGNELINALPSRDGFSVGWTYKSGSNFLPFTNLADVLGVNANVELNPVWSLNKPTISLASVSGNGNLIYGDTATFDADAISPASNIDIKYKWYYLNANGEVVSTVGENSTASLVNVLPNQTGVYKIEVTAYSNTETSLTSVTEKTVNLTVNKRQLGFDWVIPTDLVYSGEEKVVTANFITGDTVNSDVVTYSVDCTNASSVIDAGEYDFVISLTGDWNDYYVIKPTSNTKSITISKRIIGVVWDNLGNYVYNGGEQTPIVDYVVGAVDGEQGDVELAISLSGYGKNKGNYTVTATVNDINYELDQTRYVTYQIVPAEITATWSATDFTYNASNQVPTVSFSGLVGGEDQSVLEVNVSVNQGGTNVTSVNAGSYEAVAVINNANYKIQNSLGGVADTTVKTPFTINSKTLTVIWGNCEFTYNGLVQVPTVSFSGFEGTDNASSLNYSVTGGAKNYGVTYQAEVSINNANYKLLSDTSVPFIINKKGLTIVWGSNELVYNKTAQMPSANVTGGVTGDDLMLNYLGKETNAGEGYHAKITTDNANYFITNSSDYLYSVAPKQLNVRWFGVNNLVYNGEEQKPVAGVGGAIDNEDLGLSTIGAKVNAGGPYVAEVTITNTNYVLPSVTTVEFYIAKKVITLYWDETEFTYDGEYHHPDVDLVKTEGFIASDVFGGNITGMQRDVGNYTAVVSGYNANYEVTNASVNFKILPKLVTVEFNANNYVAYTGSGVKFEIVSSSESGLAYAYKYYQNGSLLTELPKEVGTYTVKVFTVSNNYEITGVNSATFHIVAPSVEE